MTITMVWGDKMKITIDNEEVLCDKNFTIEEEMLNTSSVILNNVYPATWEQDKDYTSRFYYPKDYSKCKIFNEIVHPTTREDIEGTNFSINVDTTKQYQVQTLKGQTTQSGTPTPTTPQPINITTGRQVVSVMGKNVFNANDTHYARYPTSNLITINENNITFETTTNANGFVWWNIPIQPKQLTISYGDLVETTTNANNRVQYLFSDTPITTYSNDIVNGTAIDKTNKYATITPTKNYLVLILRVQNLLSYTISNLQIAYGTDTTYEEYKGNDYEINLGKNLFYINDCSLSQNGGVVSVSNGNTITITGTFSTGTNIFFDSYVNFTNANTQLGNAMTLSVQNIVNSGTTSITPNRLFLGSVDTLLYMQPNQTTGIITKTLDETLTRCRLYVPAGTYNTTFNIQLEKGSQPTLYSPYKTPIYLGKIGTYQNYIFRNTPTNPLYDSNLEEGQWYIHKEIGRVVLNGSDTTFSGISGTRNTGYSRFYVSVSNPLRQPSNVVGKVMCNRLVAGTLDDTYLGNEVITSWDGGDRLYLYINDIATYNLNNANTWLQTHNMVICYALATPTNTLIEDEELINQLNSIELLEGLNNVSVSSPYLPFIMSLMYNYQEGYTEEDILFCGVVENTGNISLNPRHPHYCNLQVLDFKTFLSEGETLDFVIYEKTILEAINQVIGTISDYGFVLGNVNILHEDDVIGAYSTKDKTAYDVFNYIADITQSRWTTRMIDENTVAIDFYDPSLMPEGTGIDYTQEWFCDNNIIDMSFSYSSRDYRNKQVMLSGEVYANIETTEIIVADGYQTQFNTTGKIGYVSSLLLNGNPATIITKEEYDLGYEGDFVYQPGNTYFESVNLVSTGAIITIVYFAIIEGREVVLNQEEISRVSEMIDRKGVIARYENRNDATTTQELQAIGQSYLKYKGNPEVLLKVETLNNIWNIGERVEFDSPLEELTTEYMVKKKTINYITTQDNIFYTYELSSSFNSETEINYFDNQRSKMMGNIGAGEYISRNIDIENTANVIFYNLEVNEVEIDGNSTLQSELQTPLGVE